MFPSGVIIRSRNWSPVLGVLRGFQQRHWRPSCLALGPPPGAGVGGLSASLGPRWPAGGTWSARSLDGKGADGVCVSRGWRPAEQAGLEMKFGDQFPFVMWKRMVHAELSREARDGKIDEAGHSSGIRGAEEEEPAEELWARAAWLPAQRPARSGRRGRGWSAGGAAGRDRVEPPSEAGWGPSGLGPADPTLSTCRVPGRGGAGQGRAGRGRRRAPGKLAGSESRGGPGRCPRLARPCWPVHAPCVIDR